MSAAAAAVSVRDLTFVYRAGGPRILDIKSLEIPRRSRIFLHGPSGSGKTTLLGVLAGILEASSGQVAVLGRDYRSLKGQERDRFRGAHIGYIFQMFNLLPYLTVRRNITLPLNLSAERRARLSESIDDAATALAERLKIQDYLERPITELSVGQQQRVAAARALIGAPELVIADEPTSALDTDHREAFLKLLFDEAERAGASVLFVSHDQTLKALFSTVLALGTLNAARGKAE